MQLAMLSITKGQRQKIKEILQERFRKTILFIQNNHKVSFSINEMAIYLLILFKSRYKKNMLFGSLIQNFFHNSSSFGKDLFISILQQQNLLGQQIGKQILSKQQAYLFGRNKEENSIKELISLLVDCDTNNYLVYKALQTMQKQIQLPLRYQKSFGSYNYFKENKLLSQQFLFDINKIKSNYDKLTKKIHLNEKEKFFVQIYKSQMNYQESDYFEKKENSEDKDYDIIYKKYQIMQYILGISNYEFKQKFNTVYQQLLETDNNTQFLNNNEYRLKYYRITECFDDIKFNQIICKYLDKNNISLCDIEHLSDNVIISLLDNIENRLQYISGNNFIIIRNVTTNEIIKKDFNLSSNRYIFYTQQLTQDQTDKVVKELISKLNKNHLYDVIICSKYELQVLGNLRIRYLNYITTQVWMHMSYMGLSEQKEIQFKLNYPTNLISATIDNIKLTNLSQCINIRNLYSKITTYSQQDFAPLRNLKRICIPCKVQKDSNESILDKLLINNKLEFIQLFKDKTSSESFVQTQNIEKLRFIETNDVILGTQIMGDGINQLYNIFEQKYIDNKLEYQNIDFLNKKWIEQQLGKQQLLRYQNIVNVSSAIIDKGTHQGKLLNILMSDITDTQKKQRIKELVNDIQKCNKITQAGIQNIDNIINKNNLNELQYYMVYYKNNPTMDYKTQFIGDLYDKYLNCKTKKDKYDILTMIYYLINMDEETFKKQFSVNSKKNVCYLVKCFNIRDVKYLFQLQYTVKICQYLDSSYIKINFNNFQSISDEILFDLFSDIDKRLMYINSNINMILMQSVSTNKIYNHISNVYQFYVLSEFSNENFSNDNFYDVIIKLGGRQIPKIKLDKIHIRHLNYVYSYSNPHNCIDITLSYPKDLISASLRHVNIQNLAECVNLVNLYSNDNTYNFKQIKDFTKLKRIQSKYDKYISRNCLVQDLFASNKLQYVHIFNEDQESNVITSCNIQYNILDLQYFNVYQQGKEIRVKLNVSKEVPHQLSVFNVKVLQQKYVMEDEKGIQCGRIIGPQQSVRKVYSDLGYQVKEDDERNCSHEIINIVVPENQPFKGKNKNQVKTHKKATADQTARHSKKTGRNSASPGGASARPPGSNGYTIRLKTSTNKAASISTTNKNNFNAQRK